MRRALAALAHARCAPLLVAVVAADLLPVARDQLALTGPYLYELRPPALAALAGLGLDRRDQRVLMVPEFAIFAKSIPQHDGPVSVLPRPHALESSRSLVRLGLRVSGVLLAAAGLGGFAILLVAARRGSLPDRALAAGVLAAALYVPLLSSAMAVNGRYRWAAEDVAAPLAGLFLASLSRSSAARELSRGRPPSGGA